MQTPWQQDSHPHCCHLLQCLPQTGPEVIDATAVDNDRLMKEWFGFRRAGMLGVSPARPRAFWQHLLLGRHSNANHRSDNQTIGASHQ